MKKKKLSNKSNNKAQVITYLSIALLFAASAVVLKANLVSDVVSDTGEVVKNAVDVPVNAVENVFGDESNDKANNELTENELEENDDKILVGRQKYRDNGKNLVSDVVSDKDKTTVHVSANAVEEENKLEENDDKILVGRQKYRDNDDYMNDDFNAMDQDNDMYEDEDMDDLDEDEDSCPKPDATYDMGDEDMEEMDEDMNDEDK